MKSGILLVEDLLSENAFKDAFNFQILDVKIIVFVNTKYWKSFY